MSPADAPAPVLVAFEAAAAALDRVGDELRQRYGRDYEVVAAPLPSGPEVLAGLAAAVATWCSCWRVRPTMRTR